MLGSQRTPLIARLVGHVMQLGGRQRKRWHLQCRHPLPDRRRIRWPSIQSQGDVRHVVSLPNFIADAAQQAAPSRDLACTVLDRNKGGARETVGPGQWQHGGPMRHSAKQRPLSPQQSGWEIVVGAPARPMKPTDEHGHMGLAQRTRMQQVGKRIARMGHIVEHVGLGNRHNPCAIAFSSTMPFRVIAQIGDKRFGRAIHGVGKQHAGDGTGPAPRAHFTRRPRVLSLHWRDHRTSAQGVHG